MTPKVGFFDYVDHVLAAAQADNKKSMHMEISGDRAVVDLLKTEMIFPNDDVMNAVVWFLNYHVHQQNLERRGAIKTDTGYPGFDSMNPYFCVAITEDGDLIFYCDSQKHPEMCLERLEEDVNSAKDLMLSVFDRKTTILVSEEGLRSIIGSMSTSEGHDFLMKLRFIIGFHHGVKDDAFGAAIKKVCVFKEAENDQIKLHIDHKAFAALFDKETVFHLPIPPSNPFDGLDIFRPA